MIDEPLARRRDDFVLTAGVEFVEYRIDPKTRERRFTFCWTDGFQVSGPPCFSEEAALRAALDLAVAERDAYNDGRAEVV